MNFQTKDSRLKLQNGFDVSGTTTSTKIFVGGDVSNSFFTLDASGEVYLRTSKVKIGVEAGLTDQGTSSIAIGSFAGQISQGTRAIAIGVGAGFSNQGTQAIAIGTNAGQTGQAANTIVLNASASAVTGATASAFYVAPVRTETVGSVSLLFYNNTSKELTMSSAPTSLSNKTFVIPHPLKQNKYLIHACLEGPEAGVYYRGIGHFQKDEQKTEIVLPNYVQPLAKDFTIHVNSIDDTEDISSIDNYFILKVSPIKQNKFTVSRHSITNDYSSSRFNWIVYGKRESIDVEVDKNQVEIKGQGPYQYISKKF